MLVDGIPISIITFPPTHYSHVLTYSSVYQGQEQHCSGGYNPINREAIWLSGYNRQADLYTFITTLNVFRTQAISISSSYLTSNNRVIYNDSHTIAMRKGFEGYQVVTLLN